MREAERLAEMRALVLRVWGYAELRPLQAEAMLAALGGRDSLVVLATGGGKSLCYQAPALLRDGLESAGTTPQAFDTLIKAEIAKWARVVKAAKIEVQ